MLSMSPGRGSSVTIACSSPCAKRSAPRTTSICSTITSRSRTSRISEPRRSAPPHRAGLPAPPIGSPPNCRALDQALDERENLAGDAEARPCTKPDSCPCRARRNISDGVKKMMEPIRYCATALEHSVGGYPVSGPRAISTPKVRGLPKEVIPRRRSRTPHECRATLQRAARREAPPAGRREGRSLRGKLSLREGSRAGRAAAQFHV